MTKRIPKYQCQGQSSEAEIIMAKLYKLRNIHLSKDDDDRRTQGNAADDLGHAAATDRQSCKKFPKQLKAYVEAAGWTP